MSLYLYKSYGSHIDSKQKNLTKMKILTISREIEKLEVQIDKLCKKLHKTQDTKTEIKIYELKQIKHNFENIFSIMYYSTNK